MLKTLLCLLLPLVALASCAPQDNPRLRIAASSWLGFTPLYYARAKGWLEASDIELVQVVSLSESMYLFESGSADAFLGTQYEFGLLAQAMPDLKTVTLIDQSNGGDVVLSNRTLEQIRSVVGGVGDNSAGEFDAYLEMDSVNLLLLNDFIQYYDIPAERIRFQNADQATIAGLRLTDLDKPTFIVTYNPYHFGLLREGFYQLASTRDNPVLLVVDGLFARQPVVDRHRAQFQALDQMIDQAIAALNSNPREFYDTVSIYLGDVSYEEFEQSLDSVIFLNQAMDPALVHRLRQNSPAIEPLM